VYINLQNARQGSKQACPLTSPKACKGCVEGLGHKLGGLALGEERVFGHGDHRIHNFPKKDVSNKTKTLFKPENICT